MDELIVYNLATPATLHGVHCRFCSHLPEAGLRHLTMVKYLWATDSLLDMV